MEVLTRVRAIQLGAKDHDYRSGLVPSACTQVYPLGLKTGHDEGVQLMTIKALEKLLHSGNTEKG